MSRDFYASLKNDLTSWLQNRRKDRASPMDIVHSVRASFAGLSLPGEVTYSWLGQTREAGVDATDGFKYAHGITDGTARVGVEVRTRHSAPLMIEVPVVISGGQITAPSTMHVQGSTHLIGQDSVDDLLARVGVSDDSDWRGSRLHMYLPENNSPGLRSLYAQVDGPAYDPESYQVFRRHWRMDEDQPWSSTLLGDGVSAGRAAAILEQELSLGAGDMGDEGEVVDMSSVDDSHMTFDSIRVTGGPIADLLAEFGMKVQPVSVSNRNWSPPDDEEV